MPDQHEIFNRSILPIPYKPYTGRIKYNAKDPDSKFPTVEPLRPPAGAQNVLIILLEHVGFGAFSALGGPSHTPIAERLAENGLGYSRFHALQICHMA